MIDRFYLRDMKLLGFTVIGCHLDGMAIIYIKFPEREKNNQNNEGLQDGKLGEIQKAEGKKGIGKAAPEGA